MQEKRQYTDPPDGDETPTKRPRRSESPGAAGESLSPSEAVWRPRFIHSMGDVDAAETKPESGTNIENTTPNRAMSDQSARQMNPEKHSHMKMSANDLELKGDQLPPARGDISNGNEAGQNLVPTYDTCFGLICMEATSPGHVDLPAECTPGTLTFDGPTIRMQIDGISTKAAILMSDTLSSVVRDFSVTLAPTICTKKAKRITVPGNEPKARTLVARRCPIRVVVYGMFIEKDAVGDALYKGGLPLQHPEEAEIDGAVKYLNPQYLLPPGEDMPPAHLRKVSRCCATLKANMAQRQLAELEKGRILKIFDSVYAGIDLGTAEPSARLNTKLKGHQQEALVMMVEKEAGFSAAAKFPTLWMPVRDIDGHTLYRHVITQQTVPSVSSSLGGGILADEMGLGKTLSALSLICHSLDAFKKLPVSEQQRLPGATLVVTPKSTIYNWEKQIETHILPKKVRYLTYHGLRRQEVPGGISSYDIVLTTYDTMRSDVLGKGPVWNQNWARVVLDEAHKIRNRTSKTFEAVCKLRSNTRWCLTGTPIQNCLDDYGALLAFIGIPPFTSRHDFDKFVARPVRLKQPQSLETLRMLVAATCLRRTKANYTATLGLPTKTELIEHVQMSSSDRQLYEFFKRRSYLIADIGKTEEELKGESKPKVSKRNANILVLIGILRLICNHGEALLSSPVRKAWNNRDANSITWAMLESGVKKCISCGSKVEDLVGIESTTGVFACGHVVCDECASKTQNPDSSVSCQECRQSTSKVPTLSPSKAELDTDSNKHHPPSAKVKALLRNIDKAASGVKYEPGEPPPKSVIFSYWTKMLDLIAVAFDNRGLMFRRIDGQSSLPQRKEAIETFSTDPACNIMLASIGAAGEGIDLSVANAVHIVEPHWNPMAEAQATDRVHRIGQKRDVTIIRYIVDESIESYVQWVQSDKMRLIQESLSTTEEKTENVEAARWEKLIQFLE